MIGFTTLTCVPDPWMWYIYISASGCFKHWVRHPESYHCCCISPFSGLYVHIILYRNLYPQYPQNFYFFIDLPPFKDPNSPLIFCDGTSSATGTWRQLVGDGPQWWAAWIWLDLLGFTCSPGFKSSRKKGSKKNEPWYDDWYFPGEEKRIQQVTCLGKAPSFLMVEKIARPIHVCWLP